MSEDLFNSRLCDDAYYSILLSEYKESLNIPRPHFEAIVKAGWINTLAIKMLEHDLRCGFTCVEADNRAGDIIRGNGGVPAFLGYKGFPANACISINDELVHGIPKDIAIKPTDIVSIDMGVIVDGYYVDAAYTFCMAPDTEDKRNLLIAGENVLTAGMLTGARAGNSLLDIAKACQDEARKRRVHIFPSFGGHYIGKDLHQDPWIPMSTKLATIEHANHKLKIGDLICVEPVVTMGDVNSWEEDTDGWTLRAVDGSPAVHFEHTILITDQYPLLIC